MNYKILPFLFFMVVAGKSFGQNNGYKDYKALGRDYLECVLKNDTVTLANKIINKQFLMHISDCNVKSDKPGAKVIDSLMKNDYPKIFGYFRQSYNKLQQRLKEENIIGAKIDSTRKEKQAITLPCEDLTDYYLRYYFTVDTKVYSIEIEATQFKNLWYVMDIDSPLQGPYGYSRSYSRGKLIEEHKVK